MNGSNGAKSKLRRGQSARLLDRAAHSVTLRVSGSLSVFVLRSDRLQRDCLHASSSATDRRRKARRFYQNAVVNGSGRSGRIAKPDAQAKTQTQIAVANSQTENDGPKDIPPYNSFRDAERVTRSGAEEEDKESQLN